jgi:hypothetical protein
VKNPSHIEEVHKNQTRNEIFMRSGMRMNVTCWAVESGLIVAFVFNMYVVGKNFSLPCVGRFHYIMRREL